MTQTQPPALRLRDPASIAEALPFLLGYQPCEQIVLLSIGEGNRLGLALAAKLNQRMDTDPGFRDEGARTLIGHIMGQPKAAPVAVLPVLVSESPSMAMLAAVLAEAEQHGLDIFDIVSVSEGRATSLLHVEPSQAVQRTGVSQQLGSLIGQPAASREESLASVTPAQHDEGTRARLDELSAPDAVTAHGRQAAALVSWVTDDRAASAEEAAAVGRYLHCDRARDLALAELLDPADRHLVARRVAQIAQHTSGVTRAQALAVWGTGNYLVGNGAAAGMAFIEALQLDPFCQLAQLLAAALRAAVPPSMVAKLVREAAGAIGVQA